MITRWILVTMSESVVSLMTLFLVRLGTITPPVAVDDGRL